MVSRHTAPSATGVSPPATDASFPPAEVAPRAAGQAWLGWLALLALPLIELLGHGMIRGRVPSPDAWHAAAKRVRDGYRDGDLIAVAPAWADPLLREQLGDLMPFGMAGRNDTLGYQRLWAISLRGVDPPEAPDAVPELDRVVGRLRVRRWQLPASPPILYDFVQRVGEARVELVRGGQPSDCPRERFGPPRGGGLGRNVLPPPERFACDRRRPWLWVQATVMEDRTLAPRHCVYQHAAGPEPLRVHYDAVPRGQSIVVYGGIYYEDERHEQGGPVELVVRIDGVERGRLSHRDGRGWQRLEVPFAQVSDRARAQVSFEVTASDPHRRSFCWNARVLGAHGAPLQGDPRDG